MGLTGFALAGAISAGWYFSVPHYTRPLSGEARLYLQREYPGGYFKNIWEYKRCQTVFRTDGDANSMIGYRFVIYKAGGDVEVTQQNCWIVPPSTNGDQP